MESSFIETLYMICNVNLYLHVTVASESEAWIDGLVRLGGWVREEPGFRLRLNEAKEGHGVHYSEGSLLRRFSSNQGSGQVARYSK